MMASHGVTAIIFGCLRKTRLDTAPVCYDWTANSRNCQKRTMGEMIHSTASNVPSLKTQNFHTSFGCVV